MTRRLLLWVARVLNWIASDSVPAAADERPVVERTAELDLLELEVAYFDCRMGLLDATTELSSSWLTPFAMLLLATLSATAVAFGVSEGSTALTVAVSAVTIALLAALAQTKATLLPMLAEATEELAIELDSAKRADSDDSAKRHVRRGRQILEHRLLGYRARAEASLRRVEERATPFARFVTLAGVGVQIAALALWVVTIVAVYFELFYRVAFDAKRFGLAVVLGMFALTFLWFGHLIRRRGGYQPLPQELRDLRQSQRKLADVNRRRVSLESANAP